MNDSEPQPGCFGKLFTRKSRTNKSVTQSGPSRNTGIPHSQQELLPSKTHSEKEDIHYYSPCCDFSYGSQETWWMDDGHEEPPCYSDIPPSQDSTDITDLMERTIAAMSPSLRRLSLEIHDHPELMFQERVAHELLTGFMADHGFKVTKHYLGLETAWRAEYSQGKGGRVIGINSEMDALRGMGHACGHNLIAISGVGVAIALKAALQAQSHVSGKIVLLGTPAEEGGGGKVILLERGGYDEMDACIMCHPSPGPARSTSLGKTTAMQQIEVEYFGHSAHAGAAPWEGTNALDAAFLAYSGISVLRQQIKPDHRVHGVVEGKHWQPNVIPDYAKMIWLVRAPTYLEVKILAGRVKNCLQAAALATECKISLEVQSPYFDLNQNTVLAQSYADIVGSRYGLVTSTLDTTASTDFGNVSYALPSLHPSYAIPTEPNGGNHTPAFAKAARTWAAHSATMAVTKGLALTGYRVLSDTEFFNKVRTSFDEWKVTQSLDKQPL